MGAIASGGIRVLNHDVLSWHPVSDDVIDAVAREEQTELERRESAYRDGRTPLDPHGRAALLIDDGLATGSSMKAAVKALRAQNPSRIVVGVPVGSRETCLELGQIADQVVCAWTPDSFSAVGQWYDDFSQTTDDEVRDLLQRARIAGGTPEGASHSR
jgi:predicted phosphoribosyltransferase